MKCQKCCFYFRAITVCQSICFGGTSPQVAELFCDLHCIAVCMANTKARIFLADLRDFFSDLGSGGQKNKN